MINWTIRVQPNGKGVSIPTYGNYGGPNYSGGKVLNGELANYSIPPVDSLDGWFREHDMAYDAAKNNRDKAIADIQLLRAIVNNLDKINSRDAQAYAGILIPAFINQIDDTYSAGDLFLDGEKAYFSGYGLYLQAKSTYSSDRTFDPTNYLNYIQGVANVYGVGNFLGNEINQTAKWTVKIAKYLFKNFLSVADKIFEQCLNNSSSLIEGFVNGAEHFFSAAIQAQLRRLLDPIVVDVDGDGVELLARADASVFFDMDGDGIKELTGWVGKDDAFLSIDANNNGIIDNINELVGDLNRSGFAELKSYDLNGDDVVDSKDSVFSKLRIWNDKNSNGITDAGELRTLAQAGIKSIDLKYTTVSFNAEGNHIHEQATFEKTDGTTGTIVDAWLDVSNVTTDSDARMSGNSTIDALPDIRGYGNVKSLHVAMTADGALTSLVSSLCNRQLDQLGGIRAAVENILYRWAGTSSVSTTSRGDQFDGRKLSTLEAFLGTPYSANGDTSPTVAAVPDLTTAWNSLVEGILTRLMISGPLASALPDVSYVEDIDYILSVNPVTDLMKEMVKSSPNGSDISSAYYWTTMAAVLKEIANSNGLDITTSSYKAAFSEVLQPFGLSNMVDFLNNNVQSVAPGTKYLTDEGIFSGTSADDVIILQGCRQAYYGQNGNDKIISMSSYDQKLLFSGAGNDTIQSSSGNDWLDGGAGIDVMYGGPGDDTYVVDNADDQIVESTNAGTDTVRSSVTYALGVNLENLILLGTTAINGTGNALANSVTGNAATNILKCLGGDDTLDGGAGADTMYGGLGRDTYVVDDTGDKVIEEGTDASSEWSPDWDIVRSSVSYTAPNLVEEVQLTGTTEINASGNAQNNRLYGNSGANILNGKADSDAMWGGAGNDIYYVDNTGDSANENDGEGVDEVRSSVDFTLGNAVERLVLTGTNAINGTGNDLANTLTGNVANNRLNGGGGADTMSGGVGDDIYVVDNSGDKIVEVASGGTDTVETSLASYMLTAEVENLYLYTDGYSWDTTKRNGTGNTSANRLVGNEGINILKGLDGNDTLQGGGGNDSLEGGNGDDNLDGGSGADKMTGGAGNDIFFVDDTGDKIVETASGGTDSVYASVSFMLPTEVENLELVGNGNMDGQGNASANRLVGNDYDNNLDGGLGVDVMIGNGGNDTYTVDDVGDQVVEIRNEGTDTVRSSVTYALGVNLENLILLGTTAINGTGNALANSVTGNAATNILKCLGGDDTLDGGAGADTMYGGLGRDTYVVDDTGDKVIEEGTDASSEWSPDWDIVRSSVSYTAPNLVEEVQLTGTTEINASGNAQNNRLYGNSGANILNGKADSDAMWGGAGNDIYYVDNTGDSANENDGEGVDEVRSSVDFTLGNAVERLVLTGTNAINGTGNDLANTLTGNVANNRLNGGGGADTMSGGVGDDIYVVDNSGDKIVEVASGGTDTVETSLASYMLTAEVENLYLYTDGYSWDTTKRNGTGNTSANRLVGNEGINILKGLDGNDTLQGGGGNDSLEGGNGDDNLDGGSGADKMTGGAGNDIFFVDDTGDKIVETASGGTDSVYASVSFMLPTEVENLELVGNGNMDGQGNASANRLVGNDYDNNLDGGLGVDVMIGNGGNDTYTVDDVGDQVVETPEAGVDTVRSSISYVLGVAIENLTLLGSAGLSGTGNELDNIMTGNGGANRISGGFGADSLFGGSGNDTLSGGDGNDTIRGENDNDLLDGGLGDDIISGDAGIDTVTYSWATTAVTVNLNTTTAQNIGAGGTDTITTVENIIGGTGNDKIIGNGSANTLNGSKGNDSLYGGGGNDYLIGGDGNDLLDGGLGNDNINGGAGVDTVSYSWATAAVSVNLNTTTAQNTGAGGTDTITTVENVISGTGNDKIIGNGSANTLNGYKGNDSLYGGTGNDYLIGGDGNDLLDGGLGNDSINGGAGVDTVTYSWATAAVSVNLNTTTAQNTGAGGTDTITYVENVIGGTGNDKIIGNSAANTLNGYKGNDTILGGYGNDTLTGGLGTDSLTGGAGNDTFVFTSTAESPSGSNLDVITDFASGDKISLSAIDANTLLSGDQAFTYSGLTTFTGVAGQLIYSNGILSGDTNGDGTADFQIKLSNNATLTASSFIL